jgi:hypothetical protein
MIANEAFVCESMGVSGLLILLNGQQSDVVINIGQVWYEIVVFVSD